MPPLGLITVASLLPENYNCRVVDMNIEPLADRHLEWADAVLTSTMVAQENSLEDVVRRAQARDVPVVAGGPHPTTFYDNIKGVSHFVLGEMEDTATLNHFLNDFEKGEAKRVYATVNRQGELDALRSHFGDDGVVMFSPNRPEINGSPVPRFDLLDMKKYQSMAVQTSRGCPVGCEFCDIWRRFGKRPRLKGPEKTLAELTELHNLGWRGSVFVVDDNFIGKRDRTKELLRHVADWQQKHKYPFNMYTEATVNLADDSELLGLMRDAGFNMVFVGIETPVAESLHETRKFLNTKKDLYDRVRTIQKAGIEVSSGFIVGFDSDPEDIARRQIDFIQGSGIPMAMVGMLTAIRDTDLYDRLKSEGRIITESKGDNTHLFEPNFETKMPRGKLVQAYKDILAAVYGSDLKNYFERCTTLLRNLGENTHFNRKIRFSGIRAGFLSFIRQPFQSYGKEYASFLARTLKERPKYFPEAVRLAVMGHHFYKITDRALAVDNVRGYLEERLDNFKGRISDMKGRMTDRIEELQHSFRDLEQEKREAIRDAGRRIRKLSRDYRDSARVHYDQFVHGLDDTISSVAASVNTNEHGRRYA